MRALGMVVATAMGVVVLGGCGDGATTKASFADHLDQGCRQTAAYSVWLPAHMSEKGLDNAEAQRALAQKIAPIRKRQLSLAVPKGLESEAHELRSLASAQVSATSASAMAARLRKMADLFGRLGARQCRGIEQASLLTLQNHAISLKQAYKKYGVPFPKRPSGW